MRMRDGSVRQVKLRDARLVKASAQKVLDHQGLGGIARLTIIGGEFGVVALYPVGTPEEYVPTEVSYVAPVDDIGEVPVRYGYIPVKRPRR